MGEIEMYQMSEYDNVDVEIKVQGLHDVSDYRIHMVSNYVLSFFCFVFQFNLFSRVLTRKLLHLLTPFFVNHSFCRTNKSFKKIRKFVSAS